jgi:hypothetical protein
MGLIKTAVAVKTARVVQERIQRQQTEQGAAHRHPPTTRPAGAPSPAAPAAGDSTLARLNQLGELRTSEPARRGPRLRPGVRVFVSGAPDERGKAGCSQHVSQTTDEPIAYLSKQARKDTRSREQLVRKAGCRMS